MADYTAYGVPSADWLALAPTLPPMPSNSDIQELKKITNSGRNAVSASEMKSQGLSSAVTLKDHTIPARDGSTLSARSYRPTNLTPTQRLPIYLSLHGGGFLFGTLDSEDAANARIVKTLSPSLPLVVLNVNYRHTPEYTYPTAWDDVEDTLSWLHTHLDDFGGDGEQVVIGGISAGGMLAASMTLRQHLGEGEKLKALPKLRGQVLTIPNLVHGDYYEGVRGKLSKPEVSSYVTQVDAPILSVERIRMFMDLLKVPKEVEVKDTRLNVANASAEEVKGLPPTVLGIAGADPLRDEAIMFAEMLSENGVPTNVTIFRGVPHGFRRFGDKLAASQAWDDTIANGIKWVLSNPSAQKLHIKTD